MPDDPAMMSGSGYRERAESVLPGGAIGTRLNPDGLNLTVASASEARITDIDGVEWIDYVMGGGALILGHQHPEVVAAVREQAIRNAHQYGALSDVVIDLAEAIVEAIPGAERMVYTTTGSEATFYAMRMARAYTGKPKILKFEGAFHGNHDYAGIAAFPTEPSPYPRGMPFTDGTPESVTESMVITPFNDLDRVRQTIIDHRGELAGVIVEPVQRIIEPAHGFLEGLRSLCDEFELVLIFDEVVTGFRLAYGGAQEQYGVVADLASYGKIVGGGGPVGCVVGKSELIDQAHPGRKGTPGYVYASGTLHGNPLGAAGGLATLRLLRSPDFYSDLEARTGRLAEALSEVLGAHGRRAQVATVGSLWQILHIEAPPRSFTDMLRSDRPANMALDIELMNNGINLIPGLRRFVSSAHTDDDFELTVEALDRACSKLKGVP